MLGHFQRLGESTWKLGIAMFRVGLPQKALRRDQDVGVFISSLSIFLNGDLPLGFLFQPFVGYHSGIELNVSSQVPLVTSLLHVLQDLVPVGIKLGPRRIWIERKGLEEASIRYEGL